MFEQEQEGIEETQQSDGSESSSETQGDGDAAADGAEGTAAQPNQEAANTPFHEHPRFKELVEQKNQALASQKALEERYQAMERQMQQFQQSQSQPKSQAQAEKDALIERLKGIDPEFATRMEQMSNALPQVEQMQKQFQEYQAEQVRVQAVSSVNSLHEQNKVSPEMKEIINSQLDLMAMQGQLKDLKDIPTAYKQIHEKYSKFVDSIKRSERESYVTAKKVDAKTPTSQPKGAPASPASKKPSFSKDPEVARQQIVSRYLKSSKAEADL